MSDMSEMFPFSIHQNRVGMANYSLAMLHADDTNKDCYVINANPVSVKPLALNPVQRIIQPQQLQALYVYPSKNDSNDAPEKTKQLIETIHSISNYCTYQIGGNKRKIDFSYYANDSDLYIVESGLKTYFSNAYTERGEIKSFSGKYQVFDFVPRQPYFKSFTSFETYPIPPINMIPEILSNISEDSYAAYQVILAPDDVDIRPRIEDAINCEWRALLGADNKVAPSQQAGIMNEKLSYKALEFHNYIFVCFRIFLPEDAPDALREKVRAYISNFTLGNEPFDILDNRHYTNEQILEMLNHKVVYHSGFPLNSMESSGIKGFPYEAINDKQYANIIDVTPAGDRPIKTALNKGVSAGKWACGNNSLDIYLPSDLRSAPNMLIEGGPRNGKSSFSNDIAINMVKNGSTVIVFDPHKDASTNILKGVGKNIKDDVIYIDFSFKNHTPQITIRENVDLDNISKSADDLSVGMKDVTTEKESVYGVRMAFWFLCLFYIKLTIPDIDLTHLRKIIAPTQSAKNYRKKLKLQIVHPIIKSFLEEMDVVSYEARIPVLTRLGHILISEQSLRFFTNQINKLCFSDIINGRPRLVIFNLSFGAIGRQRGSILCAVLNCLINSAVMSREKIPYHKRKPLTVIYDEAHLFSIDFPTQLVSWPKYNAQTVHIGQFLTQNCEQTRDALDTCGVKVFFKMRRQDAEVISKEIGIDPNELVSLNRFEAFLSVDSEILKIKTAMPNFNGEDYSQEIIERSLNEYYLKHGDGDLFTEKENQILDYDRL
jgi:hypothetical protein